MALSGALQADFSDFVNEANKASAALGVMDAEAKKTGTTLAKTGAAVDGFGGAAGKSAGGLTDISTALRTMDQSANAAGVSLAKPIAAIEEIAQVSGKSAAELGKLGTAGAVAGAALAGWGVGRWIADLTGADAIVARLTANLMGWSDAEQAAGLNAEILAKASATAGRAITNLTEAREINYNAVKKHTAAVDTAIHRQALWEKEIRSHRDVLPSISAALETHTGTVDQLAKQYGMTAEAVAYYVAKTKDQTAAQDEATRKAEAAAAAQQKLKDSMFGGDSITKANEMALALGGVGSVSRMTTEEQAKLNTAVGEAIETYKRWGETAPASLNAIYNATVSIGTVTTGLGSEWANVGTKFTPTADGIVADIKRMTDETKAYEAETQRLVDEAQRIKPPIKEATEETQRLSVAMTDAVHQTSSLFEKLQAGKALFESYQAAGVATGSQIGLDPYNFRNQQKTLLPTMSSTGNTLNVNVNSTEAGDISKKLVDEMRRNGVRF